MKIESSIIVTITRARLRELKACARGEDSGMALFESLRRAQGRKASVRIKWDLLSQLWLATAYPSQANWLWQNGLVPRICMNGANLYGANLYGANLDGANLDGANLDGAYRPKLSFGYCDLPDGWERDDNGRLMRPAK